jgi:hypothetical protein
MTLWKKIVIGYFIFILTIFVAVVLLHGYSILPAQPGTFETLITFFSIAVIPVIVAAIKTTDFFRDDPESVAELKKKLRNMETEHRGAVTQLNYSNIAVISRLQNEIDELKKPKPRPALIPPSSPR